MKVQAVFVKKPRPKRSAEPPRVNRQKRMQLPDRQSIVPFCIVIIGLFSGVILFVFRRSLLSDKLYTLYQTYLSAMAASFFARLGGEFLSCLGVGIVIVYLGVSPIAAYAILPLLTLRAVCVGSVASWLTVEFYTKGTAYYFVCFYPAKAFQIIGLCMLAQRALRLSAYIKSRLKRDSFHNEPMARQYLIACLPGFGCLMFSSVLSVLI